MTPEERLYQKLDEYVSESVKLYEELRTNERKDNKVDHTAISSDNTFVLVAGQAAQFKPLRNALTRRIKSEGLPLWYLEGDRAKQACAWGAAIYSQTGHRIKNQDKIHGGYFFAPLVALPGNAQESYRPVDMQELTSCTPFHVHVDDDGMHNLFYSTMPLDFDVMNQASFGEKSMVGGFDPLPEDEEHDSPYFLLELDPVTRHLKINGEKKEVNTFGDLDIEDEDIFSKVWPDFLSNSE